MRCRTETLKGYTVELHVRNPSVRSLSTPRSGFSTRAKCRQVKVFSIVSRSRSGGAFFHQEIDEKHAAKRIRSQQNTIFSAHSLGRAPPKSHPGLCKLQTLVSHTFH